MDSSEFAEAFRKALVDLEAPWAQPKNNGLCSSADTEGQLCDICATFAWDPFLPQWYGPCDLTAPNSKVPALLVSKAFRHYESLHSLMTSAKQCPLCAMIETEILQYYVWRSCREQRVHTLAESLVRNRGQFSTQELQLSKRSLRSKILLWTKCESTSYPTQRSGIYIICTEWLEQDLQREIQPRPTFTSLRTSGPNPSRYPFLEVYAPKGRTCSSCP